MRRWLVNLFFYGICAVSAVAAEGELYRDPFAALPPGKTLPASWGASGDVSIRRVDGRQVLAIQGHGYAADRVAIPAGTAKIHFSCEYRTVNLVPGKAGWQDGRLALIFLDADQKQVGPWPDVPHASGTTGWTTFRHVYTVPAGAAYFRMTPANFGVSGSFECAWIRVAAAKGEDVPIPAGVTEDPALAQAWRERSATQERICLNGLWRFFPQNEPMMTALPAPGSGWCWFKVPGIWPQRGDWMLAGSEQEIIAASPRAAQDFRLSAAWYKREMTIPGSWRGRRIELDFQMLQSYAKVQLDGKPVGQLIFPGGKLDISRAATPGRAQSLEIFVSAKPLAEGRTIFTAPDRAYKENGFLRNRGITGDLFLVGSVPDGAARIGDVRVRANTAAKEITFDFAAENIPAGARVAAVVSPADGMNAPVKRFAPVAPVADGVRSGRMRVTLPFPEAREWDLDMPQNQYTATLRLEDGGKTMDETLPVRFGFRDFRIDGRNFLLNGRPVHLRGMILHNVQAYAGQANYDACRRTLQRLKEYGFNFFITSNYNFGAGSVGYMDSLYRAADDLGVLCSFSLPHLQDFNWQLDQAPMRAGFLALTDRLLELAGNHPSIVLYAMNHNATGYEGDQNPLAMTGLFSPAKLYNESRRAQALEAAALVKQMDPTRPVYNHQSGNLGELYTLNIYLNWSPIQERSNWLEHWSKYGVKPIFFVEWGPPHISSWSNYRGPGFIWNCRALIQLHDAEFTAAYHGEDAYRIGEPQRRSLLEQQERHAKGTPFQWPVLLRSTGFQFQEKNYLDLQARFTDDNWRSHRAHGISAMLLWDQDGQWYPAPADGPRPNPARFEGLTRPGIVPDMIQPAVALLYGKTVDHYLYAPAGTASRPTPLGKSMLRWNQPFCAFLGGKTGEFTEKRHNYLPGETVRKSVVLVNDTRRDGVATVQLSCPAAGYSREWRVDVPAGKRSDLPVEISLPASLPAGRHALNLTCRLELPPESGDANAAFLTQQDRFMLDILPVAAERSPMPRVWLFDPAGSTAALLKSMNVDFRRLDAAFFNRPDALPAGTLLVIGRNAFAGDSIALPQLRHAAASGANVLVMEQSPETLMERFGFRANVLGLRRVFPLDPAHPVLAGINGEQLADWAGESTLTEPYLEGATTADPRWVWCGFENTRVWRCRNLGNLASVLIEKPERGNFTPILVGGYDLQYTPLLEYREGKARILFCQLDLSGRTHDDPAGTALMRNLLRYAARPVSDVAARQIVYAGDAKGGQLLRDLGYAPESYRAGMSFDHGTLLVLGPGFPAGILPEKLRRAGVNILTLGLNAADSKRVAGHEFAPQAQLPDHSGVRTGTGLLRGVGQSDLYWRGRLEFAAPSASPRQALYWEEPRQDRGALAMLQVAPWYFTENNPVYFRKTHRRSLYLAGQLMRNLGGQAVSPVMSILSDPGVATAVALDKGWVGKSDPGECGMAEKWFQPSTSLKGWKPIQVPGMFDQQFPEAKKIGLFWYCNQFRVPKNFAVRDLKLSFGVIDDESWVWLNGKFLGEVTQKSHPEIYWCHPREYTIQPDMLNIGGENRLVVLVRNLRGSGGIAGVPRLAAPALFLKSFYIQQPEAADDPYRYYRW